MASADVLSTGGVDADSHIPRISSFLSLPEDSISETLPVIPPDFLDALLRKVHEFGELRADKLRIDVELEQSVRSADTRVRSMKNQLDAALQETQELRMKVSSTETARSVLENELITYKSSRTTVDEEIRVLRVRVQALESDKRDAMEALDRKSNDYDTLQEELSAIQAKAIQSRREVGALETQLQQAQSSQTSAKFREQNLIQELELLRKNNEWLDNELKTKTSDHQKFRREKAAQISSLQSELDDALSKVNMTQHNLDAVRQRFEEVTKKSEDRLNKIKDLQSKLVSQEENFKNEMSSQQRLAELYEKSTKSAKARVRELEQQLDNEQQRESLEIGRMRAELETDHTEREAAEAKVAELEAQVERLETELTAYASGHMLPAGPGSPQGSMNGHSTPLRRPGSAMGTPGGSFSPAASRLQKGGLSVTQLYSDYSQMKAAFEVEKRRNAKLEQAMAELVDELEQKAPEIQDLRDEHERLQRDLVSMSSVLEGAAKERDDTKKLARQLEGRMVAYERESQALKQQALDLSRQVQVLLVEGEIRDTEALELTHSQNEIYQRIVHGELVVDGETDTDKLISRKLAVFRNVKELQEQNAELLKAVRELGGKLERDEQERQRLADENTNQVVVDLRAQLVRMSDEMKSIITKSQSFIKERDMFRRMLQNRGDIPKDGEQNGQRSDASPSQEAGGQSISDVIRELQSQYDAFKSEALQNHNTLNEQARRLANEKTELEVQVARINTQLELASERYQMLNSNFDMLKAENEELSKRLSSMHESHAKQDLKTQQVAEELLESKSLLEGMRNENANLKAEKSLWKSIEQRLSQDNESLSQERARLNGLIANLQQIQSERERSDSEAKRRLHGQVEKLEGELQSTKRRLNEEIEEAKKSNIRKEFDAKEAQRRIDDLNATLANAREQLVEAKTSRDHLQSRADELTVSLKAAEEKLAVYSQSKQPTVAPVANEEEEEEDGDALSREQELQVEVAGLKESLELTKRELDTMREHVEQYKNIAQASEEELRSMNESHDAYRESMEEQASLHEAKIRDLEQRLEDSSAELNSVNQELSQIRQEEVEKRRHSEEEKAILESQINNLKEDMEKSSAAAACYQDDLRRQAGIAQEAQQNYERELVKHAEAAKTLQEVRAEHAELKSKVHQIQLDAESANAKLSSSEGSWAAQKDIYEKELGEVKLRCEDLSRQNKILLGQFESVSEQVSTLQRSRALADERTEGDENMDSQSVTDKGLEDLREVVRYLRREKEIVDVQYELQMQEGKRLKQQLDYTRNALDDTRVQLQQERQREADQLRGAAQHKELMEKISELNLLRESNSTLRSESNRKGKKIEELQTKFDELQARITPLEEQLRTLEAEKEVLEEQMRLVKEDNERWKARTQQILQKYDRVDPAELEALKEKIETLTKERNEVKAELEAAEASKTKELMETAEQWREKVQKHRESARNHISQLQQTKARQEEQITTFKQEVGTLREQLQAKDVDIQNLRAEVQKLEGQVREMTEKAAKAEGAVKSSLRRATEITNQLTATRNTLEAVQKERDALQQAKTTAPEPTTVDSRAVIESEVQRRLAESESTLRAQLQAEKPPAQVDPAMVEAEVQKRVAELQGSLQSQPIDPAVREAEVQRRVAEQLPNIEAEVQRRVAATQPTTNDHAPNVEAEVAKRVAEAMKNVEAPPAYAPPEITPDIEALVAERVASIKETLEKEAADVKAEAEKKVAATEKRIAQAREGFKSYQEKKLAEQAAKFQNEAKVKEQAQANKIQLLEQEVTHLKTELEELRKAHAAAEARAAAAEATAAGQPNGTATTSAEELQNALFAKDEEHKAALERLRQEHEGARADIRLEIQNELQTKNIAANQVPELDENGQPKPIKTQDALKSIIKTNVDHRIAREKGKWEEAWKAQQEAEIEAQVARRVEEALKGKVTGKEGELEAKVQELEQKLAEREQKLKATEEEMEKRKDALRQEGAARIRVQLNMMEKKNKNLEEQNKALRAQLPAAAAQPAPSAVPQTQQLPSGLRRPSQVSTSTNAAAAAQHAPRPITPADNQQAIPQVAPGASQIPPAANAQNLRRAENQGTGPAALRSLRGALASNIPRGGGGGGRGGHARGATDSQPVPTGTSPQQQQSQIPSAGVPPNPFANQLPTNIPQPNIPQPNISQPNIPQTGIPNPFAGAQRGGNQGARGRGFGARGRGMAGVQTNIPTPGAAAILQGQTSPMGQGQGRGLNPVARQFVPGKRGREESAGEAEESAGRGDGKRARGGQQ